MIKVVFIYVYLYIFLFFMWKYIPHLGQIIKILRQCMIQAEIRIPYIPRMPCRLSFIFQFNDNYCCGPPVAGSGSPDFTYFRKKCLFKFNSFVSTFSAGAATTEQLQLQQKRAAPAGSSTLIRHNTKGWSICTTCEAALRELADRREADPGLADSRDRSLRSLSSNQKQKTSTTNRYVQALCVGTNY